MKSPFILLEGSRSPSRTRRFSGLTARLQTTLILGRHQLETGLTCVAPVCRRIIKAFVREPGYTLCGCSHPILGAA
ncbi:hypothetical protein GN956_G10475 [Arapaima gigas]